MTSLSLRSLSQTCCLLVIATAIACISTTPTSAQQPKTEDGFTSIFDGKTLEGWKKAAENEDAWKVDDGKLMCDGERCHLFYSGPLAPMKNFHFKAEVMTTPGSNAGIYFHTKYQDTGWPKHGFECQVNVSHKDPKKTSSLYSVENVDAKTLADMNVKDNEWYTQEIIVQGRRIQLIVNGKTLVDYTEAENKEPFDKNFERRLGEGTFALQAHDPKSKVYFRNLRVKKLD
ncbi:3-keto-disaccharide hydrolase [Planctomycetes bacterium K23_9]|uniref:3-keto-alpha-glucoside-1,2-lyase/3-keto-2-hydroxy-glucal hydratase domain-containing protein n=1 Tax=Stieleria marina TaxID=1930275 RepID=A0A517NN48_9BACT|nr:hypothetical protein K239x_04620 [Planctomycetes bacterium K23_9]